MRLLLLTLTVALLLVVPARAESWPDPHVGPDQAAPGSVEAIREFTTEPRFLWPEVAHVPLADAVPSPADRFGHLPGTPGRLATAPDLDGYLEELARASERVTTFRIGRTEERRPLRVAVVGSVEHLRGMVAIQSRLARLADPRETDRAAARALTTNLPAVVAVTGGLTAGDLAGPEMLAELAHRLAVSETASVRLIRDNLVVVIMPVADPDARDKTVEWFRRHLAGIRSPQDLPPTVPPYWGKYAGEDGVRDVILSSTAVSAAFMDLVFRFRPALMIDLHASPSMPAGELARRDIVPPGPAWLGVVHNGRGLVLSGFTTGTAETVPIPRAAGREGPRGLWSLRDAVNVTQRGVLEELRAAARNRESLLMESWRRAHEAIRRGKAVAPHAWMIPPVQDDPWRRALLISLLLNQGIEADLLAAPWTDGTRRFAAGTHVIRSDQPYGRLAAELLASRHPDAHDGVFGAVPAGGRLGSLLGVDVRPVTEPGILDAATEPVLGLDIPYPGRMVGEQSPFYVLPDRGQEGFYELATRLRVKKVNMNVAVEPFAIRVPDGAAGERQVDCPPGSLLLESTGRYPVDLHTTLERHVLGLGLTAYGRPERPEVATAPVRVPRLGLYESWAAPGESGWYRYAFSRSRLVHEVLHDADLRAGDLRAQHDVILVPDVPGDLATIVAGLDERYGDLAFTETDEYPSHGYPFGAEKLTGGMGQVGLKNLFRFARQGGVLILLENAGTLAVDGGLLTGLRRVAGGEMPAAREVPVAFRLPDHPVGFGYGGGNVAVLRSGGPLWEAREGSRARVVLAYGAAAGTAGLAGRPAVIDVPVERGRVILYTFNPMERYLNHSDFRLLYNAILHLGTRVALEDEGGNDVEGSPAAAGGV